MLFRALSLDSRFASVATPRPAKRLSWDPQLFLSLSTLRGIQNHINHTYIYTLSGWWFGTWLLFFHNIYILIPLVMTNIAMYEPFLQPPLTKCLHQLLRYWQLFFYPLVMINIAMEAMAHRNRWFMMIYHRVTIIIYITSVLGYKSIWLVVWNMAFVFPFHIWDVILPIDFHIFQDG